MTRAVLKFSELDYRRQVIALAELLGYEHVGFRPAMTQHGWRTPGTGTLAKGWPDLVLVNPRRQRLMFVELKARGRKPEPEQLAVLDVLRGAGAEVHVWVEGRDSIEQLRDILQDGESPMA